MVEGCERRDEPPSRLAYVKWGRSEKQIVNSEYFVILDGYYIEGTKQTITKTILNLMTSWSGCYGIDQV